MRVLLATLMVLGLGASARADVAPVGAGPVDAGAIAEQGEFGPAIIIEDIVILGNGSTRRALILRALPFSVGDVLTAGDPRLRKARFKVLALGFFRNVEMSMQRGSTRGRVIVLVQVEERGTVVLNRFWFGSSTIAPWWFGADLSERNLLGSGLTVGAGLVYASHDEVEDSADQWAAEARVAWPAIGGSAWSAFAALTVADGSEAYQVRGPDQDTSAASHRAFRYQRKAVRGGAIFGLNSLTRLSMTARAELLDADLPLTPTRTLEDGRVIGVDLHLDQGGSQVVTTTLAYERDNRPDPVLPHVGSRLALSAELGGAALGSSYDFVSLLALYERWWPLRRPGHAIGLHLTGGAVLGEAPRFDRLNLADLNHMLSPRALGLLVSLNAPIDILQTTSDKPMLGELGGAATVEYVYRLFGKSSRRIYGGDLFVGAGLWGLADSSRPRLRDRALWKSLPIDVFVDAGLRIDTDIGVFELTVANALGRVPR